MTQTANEVYQQKLTETLALIKQLEKKVKDHAKKQAKHSKDWGFVGDMGYYKNAIDQIVNPK